MLGSLRSTAGFQAAYYRRDGAVPRQRPGRGLLLGRRPARYARVHLPKVVTARSASEAVPASLPPEAKAWRQYTYIKRQQTRQG